MSQSADSDMSMLGIRVPKVSMVDCYGLGLVIQITDGQWGIKEVRMIPVL